MAEQIARRFFRDATSIFMGIDGAMGEGSEGDEEEEDEE